MTRMKPLHYVKSVLIRSYSGLYFPAFGLNNSGNGKFSRIDGDYTSVRETKLMFKRKEKKRSFVSVVYINNETQLYDFVNETGLVSNITPIVRVETNEKAICLRKATLKDNGNSIPITVFGELVDKLKEPGT